MPEHPTLGMSLRVAPARPEERALSFAPAERVSRKTRRGSRTLAVARADPLHRIPGEVAAGPGAPKVPQSVRVQALVCLLAVR